MYNNTKTQSKNGQVFQHVGIPRMAVGNVKPAEKEVMVKQCDMYKMTRIGKVHKISTLSGGVVQMSGSCQYCVDWWEANVVTLST